MFLLLLIFMWFVCLVVLRSVRFGASMLFCRRFICQLIYFDLNSHSLRNSQTSKWLVIEMYSTQVLQRIENTDVFFIHFYIDFTRIPEIAQKTLHVLNIYFYLYILIATTFYDFSAFDFWNHGHRWIIQITDFTTIHVKSNKM